MPADSLLKSTVPPLRQLSTLSCLGSSFYRCVPVFFTPLQARDTRSRWEQFEVEIRAKLYASVREHPKTLRSIKSE